MVLGKDLFQTSLLVSGSSLACANVTPFFTCVQISPFYEITNPIELQTHPIPYDFILTNDICNVPIPQ